MAQGVEPSVIDLEIMYYISKNQPVHRDDILKRFSKYSASLNQRLSRLSLPDRFDNPLLPSAVPGSSHIRELHDVRVDEDNKKRREPNGLFELTEFGQRVLHDSRVMSRLLRREMWLKNMWIPIIVSIAMYLILHTLESLWPLILEWLASFLSRIASSPSPR